MSKRERQRQNREAARAAAEAAGRRAARRRQLVIVVIVGALVAGVAYLVSVVRGDDTETATTTNTTAAGAAKACVPVTDQLPPGAPEVPVKVGPAPTQLVTEDLKPGTGATVAPGSTVTVNYIGATCTTGKIFDSSYGRGGQPASFSLNGVIKGWTDGIPGMKVGGQRLLGIPAEQAYGASGSPPTIGPDEPLWFVVEVLDAKSP
jgi:FKBP-type peptidyl-prolyl cis-trans isomerase